MLVFIDESGDPGFKVAKGSSSLFVVGMVIFDSAEAAQACERRVAKLAVRLKHKPEFKFSGSRDEVRDAFFATVAEENFLFRGLVVDKSVVWSGNLRSNKERFYSYFVKLLLNHHGGVLDDAKVIIDGSGNREFQQNLKTYLRKQAEPGVISDVRLRDSKSDRLLQLADMCCGSIYREQRKDERSDPRWRQMLEPRIDDVWQFR